MFQLTMTTIYNLALNYLSKWKSSASKISLGSTVNIWYYMEIRYLTPTRALSFQTI